MDKLSAQLTAVLFVASGPVAVTRLIKLLKTERAVLESTLSQIKKKYEEDGSGIVLLNSGDEWQMVAAAEHSELTEKFVKAEISGELTRPQLETLTVISYCSPITKPELEQLRGVNCAMIIRNLLMRGLIKETASNDKLLPAYEVTVDYLRHLGLNSVEELPDYNVLHKHEHITAVLQEGEKN